MAQEVVQTGQTVQTQTLNLRIWYRQGSGFTDERECRVVYGSAKVEEKYDKDCEANYPYRCPGTMTVEPEGDYVAVECITVDDTSGERHIEKDAYVYIKGKGWIWI